MMNNNIPPDQKAKLELMQQVLKPLNITFQQLEDLYYQIIPREILLHDKTIQYMLNLRTRLKAEYHSDMLTCLHANSLEKQRFPAVCMLRQLLKTNNMLLRPKVESCGYDRSSGKKITKRYYVITPAQPQEA